MVRSNSNTKRVRRKRWDPQTGHWYSPSPEVIRWLKRVEGESIWKKAKDTGKVNRSFTAEAKDFYMNTPDEVIDALGRDALDALYSYSYNVGAGNYKQRVVPYLWALLDAYKKRDDKALQKALQDVTSHMTATNDVVYRGLHNRRLFEREAVRQGVLNHYRDITGKTRFNWNTKESSLPGYLSEIDWYTQHPDAPIEIQPLNKSNGAIPKETLDIIYNTDLSKYYNNEPTNTPTVTTPTQKITSAVSPLIPAISASTESNKNGEAENSLTQNLSDYYNQFLNTYNFFESTLPKVVFNSKTPENPFL